MKVRTELVTLTVQ